MAYWRVYPKTIHGRTDRLVSLSSNSINQIKKKKKKSSIVEPDDPTIHVAITQYWLRCLELQYRNIRESGKEPN